MREPTEKFVVRLPKRLRDQIWEMSRLYRRSMNAEIVIRLEFTLNGLPDKAVEKAIEPLMFPHIWGLPCQGETRSTGLCRV